MFASKKLDRVITKLELCAEFNSLQKIQKLPKVVNLCEGKIDFSTFICFTAFPSFYF